jgi:hypothetical protein
MNSQAPDKVEFEVPNGLLNVEGNDGTDLPFGYLGPVRYQQVYDASQFSKVAAGGAFITRMSVRAECNSVGNEVSSNIQVRLSTTPRGPDQLSSVFEENAGPDESLVWNVSRYVPPAGDAGTCLNTFFHGNEFYPDVPFLYDPSKGNLLLDLRKESTEWDPGLWQRPKLDAQNVMRDSVSRAVAFSLSTNKAEIVDTLGLVTYFEFFPLPTLNVAYETNNVVLMWFWSFQRQTFRLQSSDGLGPGESWIDYPGNIVPSGWTYKVVIPAASLGAQRFFRLFWDTPQPLGAPLITTPVEATGTPKP